jgi:predicted SnoaL-like aldol condensation-catalyzing enzyme
VENYFGKDSVEGSPQAGKGGEGFNQFLTGFFKAFPDMRTTIEHMVAQNKLVVVFFEETGYLLQIFVRREIFTANLIFCAQL